MLSSNRGKPRDTWDAWDWYRQVRPRFGPWARVELTFTDNPLGPARSSNSNTAKLVRFVDDQENTLELHGVNFGYRGGTPGEVVETLVGEGFNKALVTAVVFNSSGNEQYPQTIERSAGPLRLLR